MAKDTFLSPGEKIVLSSHPCLFMLVTKIISIIIGIGALWLIFSYGLSSIGTPSIKFIILLVVIALGLFVCLVVYLSWVKTLYIVTNRRVRYFSGVLGIQNKDMTLDDVQNVQYQQSFIGTIFNYGDIYIRSSAKDNPIVFQSISSPRKYADQIRFVAKV